MSEPEPTLLTLDDLRSPPVFTGAAEPPTRPQLSHLNWQRISWQNFERLCLRLIDEDPSVVSPRLYGRQGQDQQGIDLYALNPNTGKYVVYQCKRVQAFRTRDFQLLGDEFLHVDPQTGAALPLTDEEGEDITPPCEDAEKYVLCITLRIEDARLDRAWMKLQQRLRTHGVVAELWDYDQLERKLKQHPRLVLDFFGLEWARAFNGAAAAAEFEEKVGQSDIQQLQSLLRGLKQQVQATQLTPDLQQALTRLVQQQVTVQVHEPERPHRTVFDEGLERLRTLIDVGAFRPAQEEVEKLEAQVGDATPAQHAFLLRMKGNLLYRQHLPGASACLHQAFELDASASAAKVFKGMAFLLDNQPERALGYLDQARRENTDREDAMSLYTIAVSELGDEAELERLEAALTPEDRGIAFHLARHYASDLDSAAVKRIISRLDSGPYADDPHKRLLEAKADLLAIYVEANGMHSALREHAFVGRPEVQRILDVTATILPALEDPREPRALAPEALNIRQVLYTLIGNDVLALEAGRHALRLDPSQHGVRMDVSLNELRLKRLADALQTIEAGGDETLEALPPARIIKAAVLRHLGRHEDALAAIEPLMTPGHELQVRALDEYVLALLALDRVDQARQAVEAVPSDDLAVHLARANVETAAQNDLAVRQAYEAAVRVSGPAHLSLTRMLYAQYLHVQGDDAAVLAQLQPLNLSKLPSHWLENALTYFYRAGAMDAVRIALSIVDERGRAHFDSTLQIATDLAISEGDFPQAARRIRSILDRRPHHSRARVMLAAIHMQTGQRKACQVALEALWAEQVLQPDEQLMAAKVATRNGQDELARAFAYQAWRVLRDYRSHQQFANLMLRLPDDPELQTVAPESAVKLTAGGQEDWWVVVTADPVPDNSRGEFALEDPLSTALLGGSKGSTVQVGQTIWTITEIQTKYTHAAKTYFGRGEQLYPHEHQFNRFHRDDWRLLPEGVWDDLHRRSDVMVELAVKIRTLKAPVMSMHTGRFSTEAEFWEAVTSDRWELPTHFIWPDLQAQAAEVVVHKALLLHISALINLARLRLLRPLLRSHQLVVTRQTLDDLKGAVRNVQADLHRMPLKTMWASGGRIVIHEEAEAVTRERAAFLERLERLVRKSIRIVPVKGMYEATEGYQNGHDLHATLSAALGGAQHALPVVCDDLYFSILASHVGTASRARFITSLTLADQLTRQGVWPAEQGHAARMGFLGLGHTVVPLGTEELNAVLALEDTSFRSLTHRAVRNLTHPVFPEIVAARHLAQFYRQVFSRTTFPFTLERWLGQALEVATLDREGLSFCNAFLSALDVPFHLLAWRVPEIREWIVKWERERLPTLAST